MKALIEMNAPKFVDTMFATAIIGSAHCPLHTAASALAITAAAVAQPIHTSAVHCAATAAVLGPPLLCILQLRPVLTVDCATVGPL